jgi:hypothetical protein
LRIRFDRTGDVADLEAAVDAGRRAVDATPPGHLNLAGYLLNLAGSLAARFEWAGDIADLDAASTPGSAPWTRPRPATPTSPCTWRTWETR